MNLTPSPSQSTPASVSANVRVILRGLQAVLGKCGLAPLIGLLLHRRIGVMLGRIERMLGRFQAGKLVQRSQRQKADRPVARKPDTKPALQLPRRYGWLLKSGKHHAACYGDQLRMLMQTPEMDALLAASPRAKRVLRPLLRALAVEVAWIAEDPHTGKRPPKLGSVQPRKKRPKPEPFRIPLPRGALTWARKEKALEKAIKLKTELVLEIAKTRGH